MRQMISGLAAAVAVVTISAAPASACGGLFASGCSPCAAAFASPCAESYVPESYAYAPVTSYGYSGCNSGCGGWARERLPELSPQYYYVNQGPTYGGPGNFAPLPTYQESAVSGWNAYSRPYYYGYDGGPYGNATSHYYDGASVQGGGFYRPRLGYGYGVRSGYRYGYGINRGYGIGRAYGVGRGYGMGRGYGYGARPGMGYGGQRYGVARGYGVGRGYGRGGMRRY